MYYLWPRQQGLAALRDRKSASVETWDRFSPKNSSDIEYINRFVMMRIVRRAWDLRGALQTAWNSNSPRGHLYPSLAHEPGSETATRLCANAKHNHHPIESAS